MLLIKSFKVKTAKRKWVYLGDPVSRKTGYESFIEILEPTSQTCKSRCCSLLVPNDQDELEIIVDTGQDEGRTVKDQ